MAFYYWTFSNQRIFREKATSQQKVHPNWLKKSSLKNGSLVVEDCDHSGRNPREESSHHIMFEAENLNLQGEATSSQKFHLNWLKKG